VASQHQQASPSNGATTNVLATTYQYVARLEISMQEWGFELVQPVHAKSNRLENRDSLLEAQANAFAEQHIL
jgi:hypothetical protein